MSFFARLKQLREQRASLIAQAGEVLKPAETENRAISSDEETRFRALHADAEKLQGQISLLEQQSDAEAQLAEGIGRRAATGLEAPETRKAVSQDPKERAEQERRAYDSWCRGGVLALSQEERAILAGLKFETDKDDEKALRSEVRAQAVGTDAKGGYTVPEGPMQPLEKALLAFGGMLEAARVITTDHGRDIPIPTGNDTGNEGELIGENTEVDEQDAEFDQEVLRAYKFTSKLIRVPIELLEDSSFDVATYISELLGERVGRSVNRYTTLGTGTNQPLGVVTGATLGVTAAAVAAIAYAELIGEDGLFHSVDPAYRMGPKVGWMFNDRTLGHIKTIKGADNALLFQRDLAGGTPSTIDGKPYRINQNMASMAASAKSVLFGDFSKFVIRRVRGIRVVRLAERFAEFDQVGFVAFHRLDSRLIDAGTHPIKYLAQAAA